MKFVKDLARTDQQQQQSLTGPWQGYYVQNGSRRPICAALTQEGEVLTGSMRDADTVHEETWSDAYTRVGLPPTRKEELTQRVRRWVLGTSAAAAGDSNPTDNPKEAAPMKTVAILPQASRLQGTVRGNTLEFVKTYQGAYYEGVDVGDRGAGQAKYDHSVAYTGELSADQDTITGRWIIYQESVPNGFIDGDFVLQRKK
jgi:hypothetical protein